MYVESACFDSNTVQECLAEDGFSQTAPNCTPTSFSMEDGAAVAASMGIEMQQRLGLDMEQSYNTSNGNLNDTHLMEAVVHHHDHQSNNQVLPYDHHHHHHDQSNWDPSVNHEMQQTMTFSHGEIQNGHLPGFNGSSPADLLNLFHLPRCSPSSVLTNSSLSFMNPNIPIQDNGSFPASLGFLGDLPSAESAAASNNVVYDPLFPLNLPPQPPLIRELFQSLPHGYSLPDPSRVDSLFGGVDHEGEENGVLYRDHGEGRDFGSGVFDQFSRDMKRMARRRSRKGTTKHFATEQQRRHTFGSLYTSLKKLVPNPSKPDRASIVEDAIGYIKELLRTVKELKILVERKRCGIERGKRHKIEDGATGDVESCNHDQYYNGSSLRSSWLQRKSKDTEVDVRIIDDEVTIKLAQRKKINCLLLVSRVLDELQLDIQHVAGGLVGDNYSFLLNSKICEGSSVYASAIANKLIEVVDRQYSAIPPSSSY